MRRVMSASISTCLLMVLFSSPLVAQESNWSFSTGIDYSNGDYGYEEDGIIIDTSITSIPLSLVYSGDLWSFDASFSHVSVKGPGGVLPGEGIIRDFINRLNDPVVTKESGVGDIWLGASRFIDAVSPELFYLELGANVKIPVADEEKGLGSGVMDYSVQADLFKPVGSAMPFLTLEYKIKGDSDNYELDNVLAMSVGSDFTLTEKMRMGLSLDFQQAAYSDITGNVDDSLELFAYLGRQMNSRWNVMFYGYSGLKDGSPDYGLGLQLAYSP